MHYTKSSRLSTGSVITLNLGSANKDSIWDSKAFQMHSKKHTISYDSSTGGFKSVQMHFDKVTVSYDFSIGSLIGRE